MQVRRTAALAVASLGLILTIASCSKTVYVSSNNHELQFAGLRADPDNPLNYTGGYAATNLTASPSGEPVYYNWNVTTTDTDGSRHSFCLGVNSTELARTPSGEVSLRRDAGTLRLIPKRPDVENSTGTVTVSLDPRYAAQLKALVGLSPTPARQLELLFDDVSLAYTSAIREAGYKPSLGDLIALRRYGITAAYAGDVRRAGYDVSVEDLLKLSRYGVSADYAAGARAAGYDLSAEDLVSLTRYGVSVDFLKSLRDPAKPNLPAATIVDLSRKGLDPATVRQLRGL